MGWSSIGLVGNASTGKVRGRKTWLFGGKYKQWIDSVLVQVIASPSVLNDFSLKSLASSAKAKYQYFK